MKDLKELPLPIDIVCENDEQLERVVKVVENWKFEKYVDGRKSGLKTNRVFVYYDTDFSILPDDAHKFIEQTPASQFLTDYEAV